MQLQKQQWVGEITSNQDLVRIKGKQRRKRSAFHDNKDFHFASKRQNVTLRSSLGGKVTSSTDSRRGDKSQGQGWIIAWRYGVAAPLAVLCTSSRALNVIQTTTEGQWTECIHQEFEDRASHSSLNVRTSSS